MAPARSAPHQPSPRKNIPKRTSLRSVPGLKRLKIPSRLGRQAALYALRMIRGMHWHKRLIPRRIIHDEEILSLVGLELDSGFDGDLGTKALEDAFAAQYHHLKSRAGLANEVLVRNVDRIAAALSLDHAEREVLLFAAVTTTQEGFGELFEVTRPSESELIRAVHHATGVGAKAIRGALSQRGTLRRARFLSSNTLRHTFRDNPLELQEAITNALYSLSFEEDQILRHILLPGLPPRLATEDFDHLEQARIIREYVEDASRRQRKGVNVLIYGVPGTGKTEFVRALAGELGLELSEVPNTDSGEEPMTGQERIGAYTICQQLLAQRPAQLLLFDEVEDVFRSGTSTFFGLQVREASRVGKSWTNEVLESNPVPSFWLCNSIDTIDAAHLRRFDIVADFPMPSARVRRRIVNRHFAEGLVSPACASRLASLEALSPAQIERTAEVLRSMPNLELPERDKRAEFLVRNALKAAGQRMNPSEHALPEHYSPDFLNTSADLETLADGLARSRQGRLCLYGPPGTGKTAFAHHLGLTLDMPVLVKRGSDLLDCFVGGTEAKIAAAFEQARNEQAILVIDEADSFLRERSDAAHSWEVTQVNELLTQMESFDGIFIASTNLMQVLDKASLRRFDFKIRFDAMSAVQCRKYLALLVPGAGATVLAHALAQIGTIGPLTPGDFANVMRQLQVFGEANDPARIVELLAEESRIRAGTRSRGIGFSADF